jgi:hypothetical protein
MAFKCRFRKEYKIGESIYRLWEGLDYKLPLFVYFKVGSISRHIKCHFKRCHKNSGLKICSVRKQNEMVLQKFLFLQLFVVFTTVFF